MEFKSIKQAKEIKEMAVNEIKTVVALIELEKAEANFTEDESIKERSRKNIERYEGRHVKALQIGLEALNYIKEN